MAQIFYYDKGAQARFQQEKPWVNDTHFFKRVEISAIALLKMVVHVRSGGTFEVMGLMQGKTDEDAIIVMDASAFLVEGTETRINTQADAYEYMVDYSQTNKQISCHYSAYYRGVVGALLVYDVTRPSHPKKFRPSHPKERR